MTSPFRRVTACARSMSAPWGSITSLGRAASAVELLYMHLSASQRAIHTDCATKGPGQSMPYIGHSDSVISRFVKPNLKLAKKRNEVARRADVAISACWAGLFWGFPGPMPRRHTQTRRMHDRDIDGRERGAHCLGRKAPSHLRSRDTPYPRPKPCSSLGGLLALSFDADILLVGFSARGDLI